MITSLLGLRKALHTDLLTNPGDTAPAAVRSILAEDWVTVPVSIGGPGAEGFAATLGIFGQITPDVTVKIDKVLQIGDRYVVRAHATATPVGQILGVDPATGKSFDIITIDIHNVEDGKIVMTYHIEEWATAIQQLSAKKRTSFRPK